MQTPICVYVYGTCYSMSNTLKSHRMYACNIKAKQTQDGTARLCLKAVYLPGGLTFKFPDR